MSKAQNMVNALKILAVDDQFADKDLQDLFKCMLAGGPRWQNDDETWRKMVNARLAKQGVTLEFAIDGVEAMALFQEKGPFDLVLTDLYHPGPNGAELAKLIRQENPAQAIAVLTVASVEAIPERLYDTFLRLSIPIMSKWMSSDAWGEMVDEAIASNQARLASPSYSRTIQ